jgi:hypothetical protein
MITLLNPSVPCCASVDVPGVGHVHSADCVYAGETVARGRDHVAGEVPQPLLSFVSEANFIELIFGAKQLADAQIEPTDGSEPAFCTECGVDEHDQVIAHEPACKTGRVQRVVGKLFGLILNPNGKETTLDGETAGAGDGIRLRGLEEKVCLKCGWRGGEWHAELRPAGTVELALIGLNQLVTEAGDGKNVTLFTHRCKSKLYGVDVLFPAGGYVEPICTCGQPVSKCSRLHDDHCGVAGNQGGAL